MSGLAARETAADPLVTKLAGVVTEIADGNAVTRNAIMTIGSRMDRPVSLLLSVEFGWKSSQAQSVGCSDPEGSSRGSSAADVAQRLRLRCEAIIADPGTAEAVARHVRADPHAAFRSLEDEFRVGSREVRNHHHLGCNRCGTKGTHRCTAFLCGGSGTIPCSCNGDGKVRCGNCTHGTIYYQEPVWDSATRSNRLLDRQKTCSVCRGSGRSGTCSGCFGKGRITCRACAGDGWVSCDPCAATGWFTVSSVAWIVGRPKRVASFPECSPAFFMDQVRALPVRDIHDHHAETRFKSVEVKGTGLLAVFHCDMPHVVVDAQFGNVATQSFEAVGNGLTITRMPRFLDRLLAPVGSEIAVAVAGRNGAKAVHLAQGTRVTNDVLGRVARTMANSAAEIADRYQHAVSTDFVERVFVSLRQAYSGIGRAVVRRDWMLFGPVAIGAAAAVPLWGGAQHLVAAFPGVVKLAPPNLRATELVANLVMALVPTILLWAIVGYDARKAVCLVLGATARRRPSQGWWLAGGASLSVAVATVSTVLAVEPALLPPALAARVPVQLSAVLPPSTLPKLGVQLEPPMGQIRGVPGAYRVQFMLAQLGFFRAEPDGQSGATTRAAADEFLRSVPREVVARARMQNVLDLVAAALHDEFRLAPLPSDGSPALLLSNVARANLTQDDAQRMRGAATRAASQPGAVVAWSSADTRRGGRVLASAPTEAGCALFDVEVQIDAKAESSGTHTLCRSEQQWRGIP